MAEKTILNYDELRTIARKFHKESDDIAKILTDMRRKVHELEKDWIGLGSDPIFLYGCFIF